MLIDVKPRIHQPRTRSAIDWAHPLSRKLTFAHVQGSTHKYQDLISGRAGTPRLSPSLVETPLAEVVTPHGRSMAYADPNAFLDFGPNGIPNASGSFSVFFQGKLGPFGAHHVAVNSVGPGQNGYIAYVDYVARPVFGLWGNSQYVYGTTLTAGNYYNIGMAYTIGLQVRFMVHNLTEQTMSWGMIFAPAVPTQPDKRSSVGGHYVASLNENWHSNFTLAYTWDRALSDQELLALSFEPYAFVRPVQPLRQVKRVWDPVPRISLPAAARLYGVPATDRVFEMEGRR